MLIITVSYANGLLDSATVYWNILGFSLLFHYGTSAIRLNVPQFML